MISSRVTGARAAPKLNSIAGVSWAALACLAALLLPSVARADFIQLGSSSNYAVLGIGGTVTVASDFEIYQSATVVNGNVGVGPYSVFTHGFDGTINGRLDYDTTIGTPPTVTGTITGGVHQINMAPIVASALSADTFFAALAPTQTFATLTEDQVINGVAGLNVIRVTGDVTLKKSLTLNGPANAQFVFQLTAADAASAKTLTLSGMDMFLTGGVTGDNILWDLHGGGGQIAITSMADTQTVYGTFLAPYRSITVDHGIIDGRVMAGGSPNPVGGDANFLSIHSGSQITQPPTTVPVPAALWGGMALLGALAAAKLRKTVRQ
jgi:hypothetical protein